MTLAEVRSIALSLPEATEQDHHGRPSFRIGGKIFATLPDNGHLNVMLEQDVVSAAISTAPDACEELWWGKKLFGVRIRLGEASPPLVSDLLLEAWRRKAPRRLRG